MFVKSIETKYFGNRAAKFGLPNFNLNIVDTPGFEDSSQENAQKNQQRISAAFDFGVNSIILVIGRSELKLSQTEQGKLTAKKIRSITVLFQEYLQNYTIGPRASSGNT